MNPSGSVRTTPSPWRAIAAVVLGALVALVAGELFFRAISDPRPPLWEAEDGIAWYRDHDPTTIVLGSSHARSFVPITGLLAERTGGREQVAVLSLEYGTLTSYRWLVEHRLVPLMDERKADGSRLRPSLGRAIVVTDWWDACGRVHGPASTNLPARAWRLRDYVADVLANGLTDYNSNYPQNRLNRWFRGSVLVRSRGHQYLPDALRGLFRTKTAAEKRADLEGTIEVWRSVVEGATGCDDPLQHQALDEVVQAFTSRGVEVTLFLFPGMPVTFTEKAKATTVAEFSSWARAFASQRGLRFFDFATDSPMVDEDWENDLDHLTAKGCQKFSTWVLDGPLGFLAMPRSP